MSNGLCLVCFAPGTNPHLRAADLGVEGFRVEGLRG